MCKISPVTRQFLAILSCNLLSFSIGFSSFWGTINLLELKSPNSTYPVIITDEQSSIFMSIGNIGGLAGIFIIIPIGQFFGGKNAIHLLSVPMFLGTALTIFATNIYHLYVSRILFGFAGGAAGAIIPSLVNDIAFDRVRGALNSLFDPTFNLGIITTFVAGSLLPCMTQAKLQLIPTAIFAIVLFFLPESPEHLRSRNKREKANKSRVFYKGSVFSVFGSVFGSINSIEKHDFTLVPQNENVGNLENGREKAINKQKTKSLVSFSDFCTPHAKRALTISLAMVTLAYLTSTLAIISFVTEIFNQTGSILSEKQSAILVSITQLAANLVIVNIVERFGRKTLYIASSVMTAISYFAFSAYGYFDMKQLGYTWIPPLCVACIVFGSSLGILPMPYLISIEIFPRKIRQICLSIVLSIFWILLFATNAAFEASVRYFGLWNCMFGFGITCVLNVIFGICFVVETRGKSFEEIEKMMSGGNNVPQ